MSGFMNLNEVGAMSQGGKAYAGDAEDGLGRAKNHLAKMEGVQPGLIGGAGSTFQLVSATGAGNLGQLAKQMAEQAMRAVQGEKVAVGGDEDAVQAQNAIRTANESFSSTVTRPINT